MPGVFPFRLVPQGSKIVLYGAGKLGKEFYMQLRDTKWCSVLAWIDRDYGGYDIKPPFDTIDHLFGYIEKADYFVIAIGEPGIAQQVSQTMVAGGIPQNKIIWSRGEYYKDYNYFPSNKNEFFQNVDKHLDFVNTYLDANNSFGGVNYPLFYESLAEYGYMGYRNTEERVLIYQFDKYLNKNMQTLDIGCNTGFMALTIAKYVGHVTGIDIGEGNIAVAKKAKDMLGVENVDFHTMDFMHADINDKYDVIFSLAVHAYMANEQSYLEKIDGLLKEGGIIFFESQVDVDEKYMRMLELLKKKYQLLMRRNYIESGGNERDVAVFMK